MCNPNALLQYLNEIVKLSAMQVAVFDQISLNLVNECKSALTHRPPVFPSSRSNKPIPRSQSKSIFEIVITLLIFEQERRSKYLNLGNSMGYLFTPLPVQLPVERFGWTSKWRPFWKFEIYTIGSFWHKICNAIIPEKRSFWRRRWQRWRHSVTSKSAFYIHV